MKLIFRIFVLFCLIYKIVNGGKANKVSKPKETAKEIISLDVDPVYYDSEQNYLEDGVSKKIVCKGSHRYQKIEWYDPSGEVVPRDATKRVFVQDTFAPSLKSKAQALVLAFSRGQVEDSGVWECRSGELKQQVPLCILNPAEIINTPEEVTMDEGRSFTLTCEAKGNPEPKIAWYRDEEELLDDNEKIFTSTKYNHQGIEGQLTIKSLTATDSGTYICEASQSIPNFNNCNNTITTNITLNVNSAPKFAENMYRLSDEGVFYVFSTFNQTVGFVCYPYAYPNPKFRWFREIGDMLTEYSDKQFKVSDNGEESLLSFVANASTFNQRFRCLAKNEFGEATLIFHLKKLMKPEINEFSISEASQNMIALNITLGDGVENSTEIYPVEGFEIQYLEKKMPGSPRGNHWKKAKTYTVPTDYSKVQSFYPDVILHGLKPHTEYWVRVRAFNELGPAQWSFPLLVSTIEEEYPEPITATAINNFGMISGILLTGAIVVFGAICILIVKRV